MNDPHLAAITKRSFALGGGMCPSRAVLEFLPMESAEKSLWSALRRFAHPEKPLDLLTAVWPLMVGRRLALHTRPVAWSKGRVDVAVDQPEWHSQLESMGKDVRKQVNKWWGSELVREVRFVPEKANPQSTQSSQANHQRNTSQMRGKSKHGVARAAKVPAENKLSAAMKELAPALNGIADADLRELISRVAGQYLDKPFGSAQDKQAKK